MKKILIISDFSKTITNYNNPTTWSVFAKSGLLGKEYTKQRNELYNNFYKKELEGNILETQKWWQNHLLLFIKYKLSQNLIDEIVKDKNFFNPRKGLKGFFNFINKNDNIDLFIITSGIKNFIESFFKFQGINFEKIKIFGNELIKNKNSEIISYNQNSIITTLNKNIKKTFIQQKKYDKIIILGDDESDLNNYNLDCLKIGFCEKNIKGYDIYLGKEGNLLQIQDYIN